MSTFTPTQIRAAILRAADTIAGDAAKWNFFNISVNDCGTPMCAAGWIGFHLGVSEGLMLSRALALAGFEKGGGSNTEYSKFQADMSAIDSKWFLSARQAATALRAYADKHFPAEQLDPAFTAFKAAFARTMEEA